MATTIRLGSAAPQDNVVLDTTHNLPVKLVTFSAQSEDFQTAAVLFREAVGNIQPLSNSLLGRRPTCEQYLTNFDRRQHEEMRKFKDLEGFLAFKSYLRQLFASAYPTMAMCGDVGDDGMGLLYSTGSSRALIVFTPEGKNWSISGRVSFYNPTIVVSQLRKKGFTVEVL